MAGPGGDMFRLAGWTRRVTGEGAVYYSRRGGAETRYLDCTQHCTGN